MAASTSSWPAWRGMCRWRQTLGSSRTLATRAGVTCTGRTLDSRSRRRTASAVRRSTRGGRGADVVDDLGLRVGTERAPGPGDDAEGAPLVAAGLGLDGHAGAQPLN